MAIAARTLTERARENYSLSFMPNFRFCALVPFHGGFDSPAILSNCGELEGKRSFEQSVGDWSQRGFL